ncbi:DUF4197 domain-containing protein [Parvicella tangerina]|uniref:DUF4197 domain-containing protein n=1 Tax=Parvicella tangerina TaxID=2829795 RepID=A0A916NFE0_9FLAO|nr:DUF4197 domain-containing protein [Parvicella tangerina]CAG5078284.1 hypothetical protein CRYO30217_00630 [Parvicella tangerina]
MKKIILSIAVASSLVMTSCDVLTEVADTAIGATTNGSGTAAPSLTNDEVIAGLKEALTVGIKNGAGMASKMDGFLKNSEIRLPFPPDAQKVKEKAIDLGLQNKVDEFETTLNRAAEEACKEAAPIFVDAIKNMSIADGFSILKGEDNAATNYLKDKTTASLKTAFAPKVQAAIDKVQLTKYWEPLTKAYNTSTMFSGKEEVNTDLNEYVTDRAISGLFLLVEKEEKKIRKDPVARVTDILQKVFSTLD